MTTTLMPRQQPGDVGRPTALNPFLIGRRVCSPNILRTVPRTIIRFLIELLVRRTWFVLFDELYFILNWLIMRCKLRPEVKSVYLNHPSQGNSANYCTLPLFCAAVHGLSCLFRAVSAVEPSLHSLVPFRPPPPPPPPPPPHTHTHLSQSPSILIFRGGRSHIALRLQNRGCLLYYNKQPRFCRRKAIIVVNKMHVFLAVTCHLHFWQHDRGLLRAAAMTLGERIPK